MAQVETLCVLLSVIYHPHCGHVVHNLPGLSVEQVTPAVIASVTEMHLATLAAATVPTK